jgi:hypothetical protein
VRIALIANEASGGGFDPESLMVTMRRHGADVSVCGVCHARGHVIEADLPPGTQCNVDGDVRDDGMRRITVERAAFELVVG